MCKLILAKLIIAKRITIRRMAINQVITAFSDVISTFGSALPRAFLLLTLSVSLPSCDQNTQDSNTTTKEPNQTNAITLADPALAEALKHYQSAQIHALSVTSSCIETLATNLDRFLTAPTQALLNDNQQALQHCLNLYIPSHTLLKSDSNQTLQSLTTSVYSTPILPGYVDYLLQYPNSGIVNDITLALSEASLRDQQGLTASGEISIGFEVIAFILKGEQRYNQSLAPRPAIDFEEPHANRRRQYLTIAVSILRKDLTALQTELNNAAKLNDTIALPNRDTQSEVLQTTRNILNTMLENIEQHNLDSLSFGYWELLKYAAPRSEINKTNNAKNAELSNNDNGHIDITLATYLKWPQQTPDLSREAFTAQLKASLQRLQ